jgi:hypothetical protein
MRSPARSAPRTGPASRQCRRPAKLPDLHAGTGFPGSRILSGNARSRPFPAEASAFIARPSKMSGIGPGLKKNHLKPFQQHAYRIMKMPEGIFI